jgi:HEAT repeat protein
VPERWDVDVVYDAALTLARIGSEAALEALLRVATDGDSAVVRRVVATLALGHVRSLPDVAVNTLRTLTVSADDWLKDAARQALVLSTR